MGEGVSVQGDLCPGGRSLSGGVSVYGGISVMETPSPRYSNVRTVGILLECILVHIIIYEMRFRIKKTGYMCLNNCFYCNYLLALHLLYRCCL